MDKNILIIALKIQSSVYRNLLDAIAFNFTGEKAKTVYKLNAAEYNGKEIR